MRQTESHYTKRRYDTINAKSTDIAAGAFDSINAVASKRELDANKALLAQTGGLALAIAQVVELCTANFGLA
jgi:hypothetical protein